MRKFTIMIEFTAENDLCADAYAMPIIASVIEDAYPREGITGIACGLIPDRQVTDEEWEKEEDFDDNVGRRLHAGINKAPLPEDFPKLD